MVEAAKTTGEKVSFVTVCNRHLRLAGETIGNLSAELKKLTPDDRAWIAAQAGKEFGYSEVTL